MINGKTCLLVVDDEEDFRQLFRAHFRRQSCEVLEAADGAEALQVFGDHGYGIDLVVTDIRMPRLDGEQLIRELRQRRRFLPIIGITGQSDLQDKLAFLDHGAYYYLEKPIEHFSILDRLVANAIRLHRYEEEIYNQREMELRIAKLMRAYIQASPVHFAEASQGMERRFELEVAIEPLEQERPGGDYVEWFGRGECEILFYVADASGHDISAAFAVCLSNMVLHRCHHGRRPKVDEIIRSIDQALERLRAADAWEISRYLTFFIGCVDLSSGELQYVNAGHPEAFLVRPGEPSQRLGQTCGIVGLLSLIGKPIEVGRVQLAPHDLLFLYTDGANEMLEDSKDPDSGLRRLLAVIEPLAGAPAATVVEGVKALLYQERGASGFEDDVTLMAIRVLAPGR